MAAPAELNRGLPGGDCGDCLVGEHVLLLRGAPPPSMAARGGGSAPEEAFWQPHRTDADGAHSVRPPEQVLWA